MYKSLQAGRALAAIFVLLYHLGLAISAEKYFGFTAFAVPFSFGNAGVEFFFVLSGFIILTAHRNEISQPHMLASYIRKRISRIYPTYWIIFLVVYFLAISSSALRDTVPHDFVIVLKSLFLIPQDKNTVGGTGAPVLGVAWTLQYEMMFYIFFSIVILSRFLSIIAGLLLLFIYINYSGDSSLTFPLSLLAQDYIILFVIGMIVSWACASKKFVVDNPMFYASMGAILFFIIAMDTVLQIYLFVYQNTILYGIASGILILGLVKLEDNGCIIGKQSWLQLLGDSSYSLYLIHFPLISILLKLFFLFHIYEFGVVGALGSYITIFSACIICSVMFHLWIEKPVTKYVRKHFIKPESIAQQAL